MSLTHAQLSMQAAFLANRASHWAGDLLTLPEEAHEPVRDEAVDRFIAMIRETADRIDRMHAEPLRRKET